MHVPFLALLGQQATTVSISDALSEISSIVSTGINLITANTVLMVLFCAGLMGVGFRIISQAKRASRN